MPETALWLARRRSGVAIGEASHDVRYLMWTALRQRSGLLGVARADDVRYLMWTALDFSWIPVYTVWLQC
jgi:hypothetical protein